MYNGIGLQTARGSGTNGYVQRNLALIRSIKNKIDFRTEEELQKLEDQRTQGPNAEIREHARKRALELKCAEMEDVMREQGYSEKEVQEKVEVFRAMLMERDQAAPRTNHIPRDQFGRPDVRETHAVAEAQQEKNSRLKEAFGISEFFVEGSSLDPNRKAKEDLARAAAAEKQKATLEGLGTETGKKYGWIHTPSPSPERSNKKDRKDKKKKKKRSRDRSSSAESRKKHKSKKSKHSRSESPKRKKRDKKKKKEKSKRRHRSSSTSSSSSSSSSSSGSDSDSVVRSKSSKRRRSRSPAPQRDASESRRKRSRSREKSRKRPHHRAER